MSVLDTSMLGKLRRETQSEAFVASFARCFRQLLPQRVDRLLEALRAGDVDTALDAALSLKVSSAAIGAGELEQHAHDIETCLRGEHPSCALALGAAGHLPQAADRADEALALHLAH